MKSYLITTLCFVLAFSLSFKSQTDKTKAADVSVEMNASDAKTKFINNQDYLSKSSLKDYKNYYGDSAKGFDEASLKPQLLANNVFGQEYINYINILKRQYVNQKYRIGATYALAPIQNQSPTIGNKPIGGGAVINAAPCVNEDFELSTPGQYTGMNSITGWTVQSGQNSTQIVPPNTSYGAGCNANPVASWNSGSPEFSIVATPIIGNAGLNPFSINNITIPQSPLGGNNVARLNNSSPTGLMTRIMTQFPVTNANTLFQFCYAGSWDGVHDCCGQPAFRIDMYNCTGSLIPIPCANVSLTPSGQQCQSGVPGYQVTNGVSWINWQTKYIDLTPYIGQCIRIVVTNSDCSYSGHHGTAYFDARCGGQLIGQGLGGVGGNIPGPVSFCAGSNQAVIAAPLGYSTYQWIAPGPTTISAQAGGTAPTLTVSPVIAGAVYTVQLNSPSGCSYIATNTILPSVVNIAGIGSGSTCPGGASGTATVQGNGSGTGYNYTWLNSNSVTVGTASTASGLAPGIYSVVISGFGAAGCGSAVATTTVNVAPPGVINLLKPYCGSEAYLSTNGGSNFHWYNNNTLITGTVGAQANYTVSNPCNLCIYRLSYLSVQGCQDSIVFTLVSSPPGVMNVGNVSLVCPGGTNGTAVVSMTPAAGSPPGANSFSVFSTGQTPAYTSSLFPTPLTAFTATGLAAGSYSVSTFDGSCKYGTTFNVSTYNYNWNVSPVVDTLCSGNAVAAGINVTYQSHPSVFSYSWSPSTFLAGNTQQSTIVSPTCMAGTSVSLIYTITLTPNIISCVTTKTMNIVVANPATPTLATIPPLCNNGNQYNIVATPAGGIFTGANANVIGSSTGILTPTFAANGLNTYTYTHNVYGCAASNTSTFQVSQFNSAALTAVIPSLCVTNNPVNLNNIVQSTVTGVWSVPTNPSIISNSGGVFSFNPAGLNTNIYNAYYNTVSTPNATVCPDVSILPISVTKTITPYITPVPAFCNNASAINLTVSPSGGVWSGNGVSGNGVITPSLYVVASNPSVSYTVTIGPCVNVNSTILNISKYNTAALTGSVPHMCASGNPFNLLTIMQSTVNAVWSGYNVNSQTSVFNPAGLTTNNYTLTVETASSPNPTLCAGHSSIVVNVANPPAPTISQVGPFCNNGSPVQLTVTPSVGVWLPSPYLSNTGLFTPSLCPVGNNLVQYVIGSSTCNVSQTKQISIEAFVSAATVQAIPDQCNTSSQVNLIPMTANGSGVWSGQGISGTSFNPALAGAGTFTLTYNTVSSPSGLCPDQSKLSVNVYSLALPSVTKIGPFCTSSSPKQLLVSPIGGFFGGANTNAVTTQGLFNPGGAIVGDNIVNYSITAGPCIAYAQTTITVEKFVSADFDHYAGPFCKNNAPVNMDSYVVNAGGTWSSTTSPASIVGNMFKPALANIGENIVVYQTHSMPTASLCPDTSAIRIKVNNSPNISLVSNVNKGCAPVQVTFNTPATNDGSGVWDFGDGSENQSGLSVIYTYTAPGTYTVLMNYLDHEKVCGAQAKLLVPISVYAVPRADFTVPEEVLISNPEVQLINSSTVLGDNSYNWQIANLYQISELEPKVKFDEIGKYKITLTAITANGCKSEISKTIEVKNDFNIYIPSSFSPNFDKLNDDFKPVFSPYGLDFKTYEMEIFDRWGHSLFHTTDANKGWDGSFQNKGDVLKEEVYVYKIKYKDLEGNIYNKMGHVSLIK